MAVAEQYTGRQNAARSITDSMGHCVEHMCPDPVLSCTDPVCNAGNLCRQLGVFKQGSGKLGRLGMAVRDALQADVAEQRWMRARHSLLRHCWCCCRMLRVVSDRCISKLTF